MKDSLAMLQEEKRKRDEIAAIMKAKNDEQQAIMDKMIRASEFIQAHWRGMQERVLHIVQVSQSSIIFFTSYFVTLRLLFQFVIVSIHIS
jgi:hypothetical protein